MSAALLALALAAAPSPEALLLGVRAPDGTLSTWLADAGGLSRLGDGIAVPRAKGFFRLDVVRAAAGAQRKAEVRAGPAGVALPPLAPFEPGCEGGSTDTVLFVGPDRVSLQVEGGGYCEGAAHPWAYVGVSTLALDGLAEDRRPVPIAEAIAPAAAATLEAAGAKARGGGDCLGDPSPTAFALVRRQGRWIVRGGLGHAHEACRGSHRAFTVDVAPPGSLTGPLGPLPPWKELAAKHPGLVDAAASPAGVVRVLVTAKGLAVEAGGTIVAEAALPGAALVLVQGVTGAAVERWRTEAAAALRSR